MYSSSRLIRAGLASGASLAALVAASGAALAQTPAESNQLEEIVVTARRTDEALQTTPVAVTALSNAQLIERQVVSVVDLARAAPNFSIGTGGAGPATSVYLSIRGQAQNLPNSFTDAAVGIYIDGVYVARPVVGNLGFLDSGSVEVLRGPQGTLFGRNTTGGALNLTTARPVDHHEGHVKVGYGNYDAKLIEGVVNVPLSDELAARFAGRYNERDGYFPNPILGHRNGAIKDETYARGSLRWEPEALPVVWDVTGDYFYYRDTGSGSAVAAINPNGPTAQFYAISQGVRSGALPGNTPIPLGPGFSVPASTFAGFTQGPIGPIEQFLNPKFATAAQQPLLLSKNWRYSFNHPFTGDPRLDDLRTYTRAWSATSNLTVDLDGIKIKSITGYRRSSTNQANDLLGMSTGTLAYASYYRQHQFSQELQLSGEVGKLQYIFGGIYFREAGDEQTDISVFYGTPIASSERQLADFVATSKGLFAQANYSFTDALRLTAGIRYTWDKRSINRHGFAPLYGGVPSCTVGPQTGLPVSQAGGFCQDPEKASFSYPAWTVGLDYKLTPDVFLYVKTSGASMAGGFNSRPVPPPFPSAFEPEDVRDIEAGFKGEFLDRRLRTNMAVFQAWQSDVQRIINAAFVDAAGNFRPTQFVTNAGDAKTTGVEFETELLPWQGMNLAASVGYLDARYKKGSRTEDQIINGRVVAVDRSGEPITQAPKWTVNLSATQSFDLDPGTLKLHLDYAYVSSRYFSYFTTGDPAQAAAVAIANEASRVRGYGLVNGQVTFTFRDPKVEVALWGRNLLNKATFIQVFDGYTGLGAVVQYQGAPRTFGATVSYSW